MPFWDRFRRRGPNLPATPVEGRVEAFDLADAVGTIRLSTGEAVRFGRSACHFDPSVGTMVRVHAVDIGPLGNVRATRVESLSGSDRESSDEVPQKPFLLRPPSEYTSWRLACALVTSHRLAHHEKQLRDIHDELALRRGKTPELIDEMTELVKWAVAVINPVDGGTAESNGRVYQIVADFDDLELAVEVAQERQLVAPEELARVRAVIQRHMD